MEGGSEAFPDLGRHCQHADCHLLDFLPFTCNACNKVLCLDHRSYESHACPKSDAGSRRVSVCEICSAAIEVTGGDERRILERHEKSGDCDPKKKRKPTCPVRRCKEVLTFSNTATCKSCRIKVCLKHRFPDGHACGKLRSGSGDPDGDKFLAALALRMGKDCSNRKISRAPTSPRAVVKAC